MIVDMHCSIEIDSPDYVTLSLRIEMLQYLDRQARIKNRSNPHHYREYLDNYRPWKDELVFAIFRTYNKC
jgi:hypothetical protein